MANLVSLLGGGIVGTVLEGIGNTLDRYWRFQEGKDTIEVRREELALVRQELASKVQLALMEELRKPDNEFRQFVLSYEGQGEQVAPWVNGVRSLVRPMVTLWAISMLSAAMLVDDMSARLGERLTALPDEMWWIFLSVFGFWFGGRALEGLTRERTRGQLSRLRTELDSQERQTARQTELAMLSTREQADAQRVSTRVQAEMAALELRRVEAARAGARVAADPLRSIVPLNDHEGEFNQWRQ
ncbi:MAG: holin family protein [Magnetococcus sp. WYHC-3]